MPRQDSSLITERSAVARWIIPGVEPRVKHFCNTPRDLKSPCGIYTQRRNGARAASADRQSRSRWTQDSGERIRRTAVAVMAQALETRFFHSRPSVTRSRSENFSSRHRDEKRTVVSHDANKARRTSGLSNFKCRTARNKQYTNNTFAARHTPKQSPTTSVKMRQSQMYPCHGLSLCVFDTTTRPSSAASGCMEPPSRVYKVRASSSSCQSDSLTFSF